MGDLALSPILTVILNVTASFLVSKGILDIASKETFIETMKAVLAAVTTITVSVYSIYKMVELHKHNATMRNTPATTAPQMSPKAFETMSTPSAGTTVGPFKLDPNGI